MFRIRQPGAAVSRSVANNALKGTGRGTPYDAQGRSFSTRGWTQWFTAPKGFGKYQKKTGASDGATKAEAAKGKSGGSGKPPGGGKYPDDNGKSAGVVLFSLAVATLLSYSLTPSLTARGQELSWQEFQRQYLDTGKVERITVANNKTATAKLRAQPVGESSLGSPSDPSGSSFGWNIDTATTESTDAVQKPTLPAATPAFPGTTPVNECHFAIGTVDSFERKMEEAQRARGISSHDFVPIVYVDNTEVGSMMANVIQPVVFIGAMALAFNYFAGRMGGPGGAGGGRNIFRFGKSPAKRINKEMVSVTFKDVAGCDESKREIMEFVQFLKDPKKFTDIGAKIPKGALLTGPPGTGKTMLAKATAGEADVPFFTISGSDFVEMFVGVGAARVRDLFEEARKSAPCILFIDEIDAVGRHRGKGNGMGGNDERESTLNQLLVEMDGFDKGTNVVILAATNRSDVLDPALTRPGRFDRQITVDRPDIKGRKQIFEIYLKKITIDGVIEDLSSRLAALTPGFVGADIANICNEAAIVAARRGKSAVQMEDFESATDRVIGGVESRKLMTPQEKRVVAYHEAGHAVAGWFLEHADPLLKVTIIPRGNGALGFAQYLPKELFLRTREQLLDMVGMALAGRASEEVNFGNVTTGAADDLRRVTQILYQMVTVMGMNSKVGQLSFPKDEGNPFGGDRLYSESTAEVIDAEVRALSEEAYARTVKLVRDKSEQIRLVAELLLEKETISNMDVARLIGPRPFEASKEYAQYLEFGWKSPEKKAEEEAEAAAAKAKEEAGADGGNQDDAKAAAAAATA